MIYIVGIEPIETRYTGHWAKYVPDQIATATGQPVIQIMGEILDTKLNDGAFFNFNSTIHFKNTQNNEIVKMFNEGKVEDGDYFLVMDAWNATAHQIRYMADLANIKVTIGGIWHAGSYDKNDFLGRQFKDKTWSYQLERALYFLYDHNFFATDYHRALFAKEIGYSHKSYKIGFPMEYYAKMENELYWDFKQKEDLVVFPHRISDEKRPDLFRHIRDIAADRFPNMKFVICQEEVLTKSEYHEILRKAKIVFSANKQETLGIGVYEGLLCGAIPYVIDDLSYREMYYAPFRFSESLLINPAALAEQMNEWMIDYNNSHTIEAIQENIFEVTDEYFTGTKLYEILKDASNSANTR